MKVNEYEVREGLYYGKEHEWMKIGEQLVCIGITDYAQKQLGDVEFPHNRFRFGARPLRA